jgi:hypothetical protein
LKRTGIAIPGYVFDKNGKLVPSTKHMSVSKRIAQKKSKQVRVKRGIRMPRPKESRMTIFSVSARSFTAKSRANLVVI